MFSFDKNALMLKSTSPFSLGPDNIVLLCFTLQGKLALCASTHRFVTAVEGKRLMAASDKAKENEIFNVSETVDMQIDTSW